MNTAGSAAARAGVSRRIADRAERAAFSDRNDDAEEQVMADMERSKIQRQSEQ
jgi:hypothetical protein